MKILIAHNEYGSYSGEEAVVDRMVALFSSLGHEVAQLRMSTAGLRDSLPGKVKGFIAGIHSPAGIKAMKEAVEREKPDVVNIHNLYPFISPAALRVCKDAGIPVVMTVHNYRLACPTGLFMRNNGPCELCLERGNEWACIRHNCEGSMLKSIGYAARNAVSRTRRHYLECVDRFACLTHFQRAKLIQAGFPPENISVIPNFVSVPDEAATLPPSHGEYVAYSGRLSAEKGVDMIIEIARRHPEIEFRLAGALRDESIVKDLPANVALAGYLKGDALSSFYRNARFFVLPSRCYEGFPMAVLEAASFSKPVIAPRHGGFPEIIGSGDNAIGLLANPGDIDDFEKQTLSLWNIPSLTGEFGSKALAKIRNEYSEEAVSTLWQQLLISPQAKV